MERVNTHSTSGKSDTFLLVSFHRSNTWLGHLPDTRIRLATILSSAASRGGGLSLAERALFTACECWSAVTTRTLARYLGDNPESRARSLASVYAAIGAKRTAHFMERALGELHSAGSDQQCQQSIERLELAILSTRGAVDEMLRRFTLRLMPRLPEHARRAAVPMPQRLPTNPAADLVAAASVRWRTENRVSR